MNSILQYHRGLHLCLSASEATYCIRALIQTLCCLVDIARCPWNLDPFVKRKGSKGQSLCHGEIDPTLIVFHHFPAEKQTFLCKADELVSKSGRFRTCEMFSFTMFWAWESLCSGKDQMRFLQVLDLISYALKIILPLMKYIYWLKDSAKPSWMQRRIFLVCFTT